MPKFYVQCGSVRQVVDTESADQAALSLVDEAMQPHLWIYSDSTMSNLDRRDHLMVEALLHMDSTIQISERGHDRHDAQQIGTPEMIEQWHKLIIAVTRLFVTAGLVSRTPGTVATDGRQSTTSPRFPR